MTLYIKNIIELGVSKRCVFLSLFNKDLFAVVWRGMSAGNYLAWDAYNHELRFMGLSIVFF